MKTVRLLVLAALSVLACSRGPAPRSIDAGTDARRVGVVVPGPDFTLGQGDRNVPFAVPVFDENGQPISLVGATISFRYRIQTQVDGGAQGAGAGKVTGPAPGLATYVFTANDTATPGTFNAEFTITLALPDGGVDGSQQTFSFPQSRYLRVVVRPGP